MDWESARDQGIKDMYICSIYTQIVHDQLQPIKYFIRQMWAKSGLEVDWKSVRDLGTENELTISEYIICTEMFKLWSISTQQRA